jgi:dATP pyrophosphohydrolase
MAGPAIRTDIIELYVFRRPPGFGATTALELLQLQRAADAALPGTWQPVMGHIDAGETAPQAALREAGEEVGLERPAIQGFWQLEEPSCFYLHAAEAIMLSPCLAMQVAPDWQPTLNHEHRAHRWVPRGRVDRAFLWPGQRRAIAALQRDILEADSPTEALLRIALD